MGLHSSTFRFDVSTFGGVRWVMSPCLLILIKRLSLIGEVGELMPPTLAHCVAQRMHFLWDALCGSVT